MTIQTVTERNSLVDKYKADCTHVGLASATPTSTISELAVTRQASNWGATGSSAATAAPTAHSVAGGLTVAGMGFFDAASAGNYRDGAGVTSQAFSSAGTYQVTATVTIS